MTGYLALDRDAVDGLRRAVARSLDELSVLRSTDPAARAAQDELDRAGAVLGGWDRRLTEIARCAALTDLVTFGTPGLPWSTVLPDTAPMTADDITIASLVLADRLRSLDSVPTSDAFAVRLGEALSGAAPAVVAATLAALGPEWLTATMQRLARGVDLTAHAGDPDAFADVDATMATVRSLGAGFATVVERDPAWERAWNEIDLALAAELLAGAGARLSSGTLARLTGTVLERAAGGDPSPWWRHAVATALDTVSTDPVAARTAFLEVDDATLDVTLFGVDPVAAGRFVRSAASAEAQSVEDAAAPVSRLVEAIARMSASADFVRFTDAPGARPGPPADWWLHPEGHPITDPSLPVLTAEVIGPWLPWLITPIQLVSWQPATDEPAWPAADTDALSAAVTLLMTNAADAAVLRLRATQYLAASIDGPPATQQHAAYLVGAIEDAGRGAAARRDAGVAVGIDALATTVGLFTSPVGGLVTTAVVDEVSPDGRDLVAEADAAGFDVAAGVGLAALGIWRAGHVADVPPLPPIAPPGRDVDPDDRADRGAGTVARRVQDWAETIEDPQLRAEALALYDRVESAAAQGTGFTA